MSLVESEITLHHEDSASSNVCDIFLSHSGDQKPFVRQLYDELVKVNHTRLFFDEDTRQSLPRGCHFPSNILSAIQSCKLGVVVISQSFIMSFWPMLELQHLIQADPELGIYPIFYELEPGDLVKQHNLNEWQERWEHLAMKIQNQPASYLNLDIHTWLQALQKLRDLAGTIIPATSSSSSVNQMIHQKLDDIVAQICDRFPPPRCYDDPLIMGKEHTAQVIEQEYKAILQDNKNASTILVLGVVGIGGSGKSTLCETMVDYYGSHEFHGRSALLKFPTEETDMQQLQLIQGFKSTLKIITSAPVSKIEGIFDIKQAISLLKQASKTRKYFLALDNVWEWSKQYVQQILSGLISNNMNDGVAKVIVTSRSESLLEDFTRTIINVPELTKEEALQILLSNGGRPLYNHVISKSIKIKVEGILETCFLSCAFHPLLIKTLGNILSQVTNENLEQCMDELENISFGLNHVQSQRNDSIFQEEIEKMVSKTLEVNYNHLPDDLKNMFMDIAILYPRSIQNFHEFLALKGYQSMKLQVSRLQHFGLLRVFGMRCDEQIGSIEIHDLYKVLAKREAQKNGRFLVLFDGLITICPSSCSLSKVTRIISSYAHSKKGSISVSDLEGLDFCHLAVNKLEYVDVPAHDLKVLYDEWRNGGSSTSTSSLKTFLGLKQHTSINLFPFGHSLSILKLECGDKFRTLDGLCQAATNLQILELTNCNALEKIKGLGSLKRLKELTLIAYAEMGQMRAPNGIFKMPSLSGLIELIRLSIEGFEKLKRLSYLHCPQSLQSLILDNNPNLVDVGDIGFFGKNLVHVSLSACTSMKEFPNVVMPKLKKMSVYYCHNLESIIPGGTFCDQNFPCLEEIRVEHCEKLKVFPRIEKPSKLRTLYVCPQLPWRLDFDFDLQASRFGLNTEKIEIPVHREQFLVHRNQLSFAGLPNLHTLDLKVNGVLVQSALDNMAPSLPFLSQLGSLESLRLENFYFIRSLEVLSCLTRLRTLRLSCFNNLESLPRELPLSLRTIDITGCCVHLESLNHWLSTCNLESLTNLDDLRLQGFTFVRRLDGLSSLPRLNSIFLKGFSSLQSFACNSNIVNRLILRQCPSLRMLPYPLPKMQFLECPASVENLHDALNSCTTTLRDFSLYWPTKFKVESSLLQLDLSHLNHLILKGYPASNIELDLTTLTRLWWLCISDCEYVRSMRGVVCPTSLEGIQICNCPHLEELPEAACRGELNHPSVHML